MTNEELQQCVTAVLSALKTNSKTIAQLTAANSVSDSDYVELNGGRKVSLAVLFANLATGAQLTAAGEYLDQNKVGIHNDGLADWTHARVVYLDGMGSLDGGGQSGTGIYYNPSNQYIYDFSGGQTIYQNPKAEAVYISKITLKAYSWNGTDLVEIGEYVKNRQVIDYMSNTPSFEDMAIGTMYYVRNSSKLAIKISESATYDFDPNPNIVYAARDTNKCYYWDASNHSWQQLG